MSTFKSSYDNSSHTYNNVNNICSNFNHIHADIIKNINDQLFFDDKLDYNQKMYLLNHHSSIEEHFLNIIIEHVRNLTLNDQIRQFYLDNINKFSSNLFHVHRDSHVNFRHYVIDDDYDDTEDYVDDYDDELNEPDNDDCDDLENLLLDEYEIEFYYNNNNNNNNNNNRNINPTSHSFENRFESGFDEHYDDD